MEIVEYYPFYAGKVVYEIVKRLSANGIAVSVVSSDFGNNFKGCYNGNNVIRIKSRRVTVKDTPFAFYNFNDLRVINKNLDVDIIHVHFVYSELSLYIGFVKKFYKLEVPLVATCHGLTSGYNSKIVQIAAQALKKLSNWLVLANCSTITTVSKLEFEQLSKSVASNRLCYIPNGVDTSCFRPDEQKSHELRSQLGIDKDKVVVLYFAHLRAAKGVLTFMDAVCKVIGRTDNVQFIIAGSGPLASYIKEKSINFGNKVHAILGFVPDADLPYLYNACDIYVLPSYVEGMPLSVMEAMACGKPVIASNVGDTPVLIKNNVNGFLIPPGQADILADKIIDLSKDLEKMRSMGRRNAKIIEQYNWDEVTRQYQALYNQVLSY